MEKDDDIMFNISKIKKPNKQQPNNQLITNKLQLKRMKYSRKLRQQKSNPKPIFNQTHVTLPKIQPTNVEQHIAKPYKRNLKTTDSKHYSLPNNFQSPNNIKTPTQLAIHRNPIHNNIDINSLQQLNLHPSLISSLQRNNIDKVTNIQQICYEPIFKQRDCIVKANTGSGKTLAYLIPLINQMANLTTPINRSNGTVVLVICPSRQLCMQADKQSLRCLKRLPSIVPGCLVGGEGINHQKNRIRKGITILFCTPGRLLYHLKNTQCFKLDNLSTILFEQADRTLDMGFQPTLQEIIKQLSSKISFSHLQKILVSAHFNEKVTSLIQHLQMNNPQYIGFNKQNMDEKQINTSVNLQQKYVLVSEEERIPLLIAYVSLLPKQKILIFVNTVDEVVYFDMVFNNLMYKDAHGVDTNQKLQKRKIYKLHGDLDQKLRTQTYFEFRDQKSAILISTEVASRGLDFPDLSHIVLFDPPPTITDYGNRVGRSGRFNSSGVSLMILHYQQSDFVEKIRYYDPKIQLMSKDTVFKGYSNILKDINIGDHSLHYLEGLIRSLIKTDNEKYQVAKKAFSSMLRAYARLPDKDIFILKKLNLKLLGRSFGLNSGNDKSSKGKQRPRQTNFNTMKKRRKVEDVRALQFSEYM